MSRFRGGIERRIFEAVVVVLAGCSAPPEPRGPTEPTPPGPDRSPEERHGGEGDGATFATAPPPADAAVTADAADRVAAVRTPKSLCEDHRRQVRVDGTQARQGKPPMEGARVRDTVVVDPATGVVTCTIVRERVPGTVTVMHTPHWCPQGGGVRPGPSAVAVPGEKVLVERVQLSTDGTIVRSELEWTAFGTTNEPRHNCGRRFEGFEDDDRACDEVGAQLAAMAELEAASVPAFERLARELAHWGAPAELVRRARRAMGDEIRHARVMDRLARGHGHAPRAVVAPPLPCRELAAIAHENAVEGCVREAYGAVIATWQAERAEELALRPAFRAIAADERRHAALAEAVHAWILDRLDDDQRAEIERARVTAGAKLRASLAAAQGCRELGLPGAGEAIALCDAYFA